MFYIVYGIHDTEYSMHNSKKPLFLLKQASSSAVPNPDLLPIFFWFPLPETSWHPPPRPPRLRGTMPSSPAPVVHICQELGARRKTGAAAAGRARTPRMQGLRWSPGMWHQNMEIKSLLSTSFTKKKLPTG